MNVQGRLSPCQVLNEERIALFSDRRSPGRWVTPESGQQFQHHMRTSAGGRTLRQHRLALVIHDLQVLPEHMPRRRSGVCTGFATRTCSAVLSSGRSTLVPLIQCVRIFTLFASLGASSCRESS